MGGRCAGAAFTSGINSILDQGGVVDRTCNPYVETGSKTNTKKCGYTVKHGCRKYSLGKDKIVYKVSPTVQHIKVPK